MLAYAGTPMGSFEDQLLRESVDLVIPHRAFLKRIHAVAPNTPQLLYTNVSSVYLDLLLDWLTHADQMRLSRESAFYHAARPQPFRGNSPSSRPVTWFWGVYRGRQALTNLTAAAHGPAGRVAFGSAGESLWVGYPERFREITVTLAAPAGGGWSVALEYPAAVNASGTPTAWAPLPALADTTAGLTQSGQITFDPPAGWQTAAAGGSARLYYVRFRTTAAGTAPVAAAILGRDYVAAQGQTAGVIPAFDRAADADKDDYLNDREYSHRAPGKDARFLHESRMFAENYGQMRFSTNPSDPDFRDWAVASAARLLNGLPLAGGLFLDNSPGRAPVKAGEVLEPVAAYATDYASLLGAISRAIAPRWILANTAGGQATADPVIRQNPAYFEEFAIRPLAQSYVVFENLAALLARRAALATPAPYAVIDSHPQRGSPTDPRMQLATLAYYYLLADPEATFLMFYGGSEPATSWRRHWLPAVAYDIGQPTGTWSQLASGADPANPSLTYRVYQRSFEKALVLYKPLSYARGAKVPASLGEETATTHALEGAYRPLGADGQPGEPVRRVTLRNGEGAILLR
jgi:hypothetical protein